MNPTKDASSCKVRVAVRIRPLLPHETPPFCITLSNQVLNELTIGTNRSFLFDKAFDSSIPQKTVYEACVLDLLKGFFTGYNATILAYGQTGSGKTYTMGSSNVFNVKEEELGIIPRVIRAIFQEVELIKVRKECLLKVSFLEIYNEEIIDLLDPKTIGPSSRIIKKPSNVTIREEKDGSIGLFGLIEEKVSCYEELISCLERGSLIRSTSSTLMNENSSRSHAIFSISLEQHSLEDLYTKEKPLETVNSPLEIPEFITAKFHFVDLAGSERLKRTGATGSTLKEGININKGLLCLGNVIAALTEAIHNSKSSHVPYRDSKLTRILQDSLGGNARTFMIACVSPAESNFDESLNTLKYASRARNINNKPKVNTDPNSAMVNQLKQLIFELKEENMRLKQALKRYMGESELKGLEMPVEGMSEAFTSEEGIEVREIKVKVVRIEKELLRSEAEKHIMRKELMDRELEMLGLKRERDLLRVRGEKSKQLLEENKLEVLEEEGEEEQGTMKIIEEYSGIVEKLKRDLEDKDVILKEVQGEYEKLLRAATRDQNLLVKKTEQLQRVQRMESRRDIRENENLMREYSPKIHKNVNNSNSIDSNIENEIDPLNDTNAEEEGKENEFFTVSKTTEKQLILVDETIRMKEELLNKMSAGQNYLEQSLLEEMRHQYYLKIETLQQEIKLLSEKERDINNTSNPNSSRPNLTNKPEAFSIEKARLLSTNKARMQELESQIRDFKKKEKMKEGLLKQVSLQKTQLESLAEEIKAIKKQKIQLMKKLKEDSEAFEKWKASHQKKLNDLSRKNQEKDLEIQKLRIKSLQLQKNKYPLTFLQRNKENKSNNFVRRRSFYFEDSNLLSLKRILLSGLEGLKRLVKRDWEVGKYKKDLEGFEEELKELEGKHAKVVLELERLGFEKGNRESPLDLEEQMAFEKGYEELLNQKRELDLMIESFEENLRFKKAKINEKIQEKVSFCEKPCFLDEKRVKSMNIEPFLEELLIRNSNIKVQDPHKELIKAFYECYGLLYEVFLTENEKASLNSIEAGEFKRKYDSLEQKLKVSQAQYELNLTKISSEYEERCLFLMSHQNEQMLETGIESINNEGNMIEPHNNEINLNETGKLRTDSIGIDERKKGTGWLKKQNEELIEKVIRIERSLSDVGKKQQNSDKLIQILKRKLEIVTEKYDQMKKQFSKEKYIGLPKIESSNPNISLQDFSGYLDSPIKTPRKESKPNYSLMSLKERREQKKVLNLGENNEIIENKGININAIVVDLEGLQDRMKSDSSAKIHKKNISLQMSKKPSRENTVISGRSGFVKDTKQINTHKWTGDNNNSFENVVNNGSLVILDSNLENEENLFDCLDPYPTPNYSLKATIPGHSASVYSICSYGNLMYSSSNKSFKVWSLDTMKQISEIGGHHSFIKSMILWPEKNILLTACEKTISAWDTITLKPIITLKAHKDEIRCLHAFEGLLFSAGKGSISSGALFAWDLRSPNFLEEKEKNQDIFSLLGVGNILYYGSRNHQVCRLNLGNSLEHLSPFESPHFDAVSSLVAYKDQLISGSRDKNLKLWNLEKSFNNNLHTAYAHQDWINVLEKNRQENMFFSGSRDGLVKVWGVHENKLRCLSNLNSHSQSVNGICILDEAYESMIATASSDKTIKLWKLHSDANFE